MAKVMSAIESWTEERRARYLEDLLASLGWTNAAVDIWFSKRRHEDLGDRSPKRAWEDGDYAAVAAVITATAIDNTDKEWAARVREQIAAGTLPAGKSAREVVEELRRGQQP